MTIDELMDLLEGCRTDSEVRLAVAVDGRPPVEAAIVGITSSNRLPPARYVPGQGDPEPGTVWILSGEPFGPMMPDAWSPTYRRRP